MHPIFLAVAAAAFLLHWFIVPARFRGQLVLLVSLAWAGFCARWLTLVMVLLVVVVQRAAVAMARTPGRRDLLALCLSLLVGNLVLFKVLSQLEIFGDAFVLPVGLSYVTFRLIHVVMDTYFGRLEPVGLEQLATYSLFFPTFAAGPVERLNKFSINQGKLDPRHLNFGLLRVASGIAKKVLLADQIRLRVYPLVAGLSLTRPLPLMGVSYGLLGVLYLDFSAYSDIAIGAALLLGIRVMENFDWPLLKPSLPEFWRAWHISVYSFIRDYFFFPLFATRASELKMQAGLCLSFVVFMLWHRISPVFLVLGLYLGLGVVGTAAFQRFKARRPGLRKALRARALRPLFVLLTVSYIALGTLILHWDGYLTAAGEVGP